MLILLLYHLHTHDDWAFPTFSFVQKKTKYTDVQFSSDAGLTIQGNTNTVQYSVVGDTPNMEYSVVGPKTNTSQVSVMFE